MLFVQQRTFIYVRHCDPQWFSCFKVVPFAFLFVFVFFAAAESQLCVPVGNYLFDSTRSN